MGLVGTNAHAGAWLTTTPIDINLFGTVTHQILVCKYELRITLVFYEYK